MKIDPYKHKERYLSWKSKNNGEIKGMTKANSDLTMKYLSDMEKGINIAQGSVKGPRSFIRLNSIRDKMRFFSQKIKELFNLDDLTKITEEQLIEFFGKMRTGELKKLDGKEYTSTDTFARAFKSFWHWHQKATEMGSV